LGRVRRRLGRYKRQLLGQPLATPARTPVTPSAPAKPVPPAPSTLSPLDQKREELAKIRAMGPATVRWLIEFLRLADEVVTVQEAARRHGSLSPRTVILRHDIDHDIENAVRLAELEHAAGFKSTYFVLHSAWYYRWESTDGEIAKLTLDALQRIASMGHEIGLHNDTLGVALTTGADPVDVLRQELAQLRAHGFEIVGSAAHGGIEVRNAKVVNYQIFAERSGNVTQTHQCIVGGAKRTISYTPVPLADVGLGYEAYSVPYNLYLSDSRGRWNQSPQWVASEFRKGKGPLQVLTHPEYWALSGETLPLRRPPRDRKLAGRPGSVRATIRSVEEERPTRIIARADCCCRRAVHMNLDMFGGRIEYIKDEKSRSDFFVDHAAVGSPGPVDMMRYVAVERINNASHRYYQFCQTDRATLDVRNADLLVLDSYADMNFQAWQHRVHGWRLWIPMAFIRDRDSFISEFDTVGYLSLDESVAYHVALIDHYRQMNGHIPVLFLNQPIAYFDKLQPRSEFSELGARLEKIVPDLYYGTVDDDDLEPDDMGSSGPGQTLHFTAATYRRMIDVAMEKGLAEWIPRTSVASRG
jgi:hypothetical protein